MTPPTISSSRPRVAIVCPNYYPRTCGVGDYSMRVAAELVARGVDVRVFSREPATCHPDAPEVDVVGFLATSPSEATKQAEQRIVAWGATHVFIQYVPHMFGGTRFGTPAMPAFARHLRRLGLHVTLVAHELFIPWSARPDLAVGSVAQRLQTAAMVAFVDRLVVTTQDRHAAMRPIARAFRTELDQTPIPVGSNVTPVAAAPGRGRVRLGIFSSLSAEKRFDVVLAAFERVAALNANAELALVGDFGTSGTRRADALLAAVRDHPNAERITLTGRIPLADVANRVASLDVFLFPMTCGATSRSGTLPVALGAGVPVVAVRGRETPAYFDDGQNIVFADALTGAAFAEAVLRLIEDPALHARVSAGARRLFQERLTWSRIVDRLAPAIR